MEDESSSLALPLGFLGFLRRMVILHGVCGSETLGIPPADLEMLFSKSAIDRMADVLKTWEPGGGWSLIRSGSRNGARVPDKVASEFERRSGPNKGAYFTIDIFPSIPQRAGMEVSGDD